MSQTATASATDTEPRRHKVTGDVHLLLRRGNEVLFGQRRNTGFEDGAWHLPPVTSRSANPSSTL